MITKLNEELLNEELQEEVINEAIQIGDKVMLDKQRGYVVGQTNDGDLLVQIQYSVKKVTPKKVKGESQEPLEITPDKQFKFDKVSQKLLFEQYVRCGIFMDKIPVKITECFVKYSDYIKAGNEETVNIVMEGNTAVIPKKQVKLFEDVNNFGNPDNYIAGTIVNEETEKILENVMINATDYINSTGDADPVRIVRGDNTEENQVFATVPRATLRPEQK